MNGGITEMPHPYCLTAHLHLNFILLRKESLELYRAAQVIHRFQHRGVGFICALVAAGVFGFSAKGTRLTEYCLAFIDILE
ncbi:MAG: hypothetical protein LBH79_07750 [Nitrososphaerota archaeon]|jgi:hypothetical protein|nr:hypothetical protein [Nitrososphaerota archaeon]